MARRHRDPESVRTLRDQLAIDIACGRLEIAQAVKLGIKKIIIASSETTYGVCFSNGEVDPKVLPMEEDYDIDPMDSYGMSKKVNEVTARSFQRRSGFDIYALRIGNVIEPHEYAANFPGHAADKRILVGELIVEVGQEPVNGPQDVTKRLEALKKEGKKSALLLVSNGQGEVRFVAVAMN